MPCRQTTPMNHGGVSGVNTTAQRGRMGPHIPTDAVDNSGVAGRAVVMCGRCSCYPRTSSPGVSGEYERVARAGWSAATPRPFDLDGPSAVVAWIVNSPGPRPERWIAMTVLRLKSLWSSMAQSKSLRHICADRVYRQEVRSRNEMVLICSDDAADRFTPSRRHAGVTPGRHGRSTPLPHACPNSDVETACHTHIQPYVELANHWVPLTPGDAEYELAVVRGGISRAQP